MARKTANYDMNLPSNDDIVDIEDFNSNFETIDEKLYAAESGSTANNIVDLVYPVGSVYMSTSPTEPSELFEGTEWERIEDRFLLAAGGSHAAGETGGEESHLLTSGESGVKAHGHGTRQPSIELTRPCVAAIQDHYVTVLQPNVLKGGGHYHNVPSTARSLILGGSGGKGSANIAAGTGWRYTTMGDGSHSHELSEIKVSVTPHAVMMVQPEFRATDGAVESHVGEPASDPHNNMPPYLAVHMWTRVG